jgi:L-seryl-tRNA(Ser) seleniumtransferase
VRADKLCLAALSATLTHYLKDEAVSEVPIWRMIASTPEQIKGRTLHWMEVVGQGEVVEGESTIGGGSLPGETLPTYLLALDVRSSNSFLKRLRGSRPPIIARTKDDRVVLDPRTVLPEQEEALILGLSTSLNT